MKKIIASILAVFTLGLVIAPMADAIAGYDYYCGISFSNTGADTITGRFRVPTNAKVLVDGCYIQADAEDVAIVGTWRRRMRWHSD